MKTIFKSFIFALLLLFMGNPVLAFADTSGASNNGGAGAAQNITGSTALNWAGYVSQKGVYTGVSGSWVVPSVTSTSQNAADAAWVGIGGVLTHDLIQAGT